MEPNQAAKDLEIIRQTMEASMRYTNVPALGYLTAGGLGLLGVLLTYVIAGWSGVSDPAGLSHEQARDLTWLWLAVLVLAAGSSAVIIAIRSAMQGVPAWNSLAARMYGSQMPLVLAAGILTLALGLRHQYDLVPAVWLLGFGVIIISFSAFTGALQRFEGLLFLLLGAAAAFSHGHLALLLLAAGFGVVLLGSGLLRYKRQGRLL
jgi:hypothetical protein